MMQYKIDFREIKSGDYPAIEKIICDTWNYEKFCTPKTARALAKLYLATCLVNQTYTCVALNNNEPTGIIMGKNETTYHATFRYTFRKFAAFFAVLITKDGRRVLKMFHGFDEINKSLFTQSTKKFHGEVSFFAVRRDQRGTGVGKELWSRLNAYMRSQNIADFYLYTDSTCNYGFYEHQGMQRICEKKHSLKAYQDKEMSFFLYGYSLYRDNRDTF